MNAPLHGLLVADFTRVLSGPTVTMLLADLGADVIKVERPGGGDETRAWGPPWTQRTSSYFEAVNRTKRSVVLDLTDDADRELARELIARADILVENFRAGTMDRLGLGYDAASRLNPAIVYCSLTGFGDGAGAELPGYDFVLQAVGGLMSITGDPTGAPTKVGVALVDVLAGKDATIGILAALAERQRGGAGQHVRVNLLSSLLGAMANQASSYLTTGVAPERMGNRHPSIPRSGPGSGTAGAPPHHLLAHHRRRAGATPRPRPTRRRDPPLAHRRTDATVTHPAPRRTDPLDTLGIDDLLTSEERAIRDAVRNLCDKTITPHVGQWFEAGQIPDVRGLARELGTLGVLGMHLDGYGCAGLSAVDYGLACRELEAADSGLRSLVSVQGSLAMFAIWRWGGEAQKQQWLPRMATGDLIGCLGLTEPDHGSDPAGMRTRARQDPSGDWVLDGRKMWITNATIADVAVIWANVADGDGAHIRGFITPSGRAEPAAYPFSGLSRSGPLATAAAPCMSRRRLIGC